MPPPHLLDRDSHPLLQHPPSCHAYEHLFVAYNNTRLILFYYHQEWGSCKGSVPNARGYTCGLWMLFHSMAARVRGDTGGALWMAAVRGFMAVYFQCSDCRQHFAVMAGEADALAVSSPQQALLWAWTAHNRVRK